MWGRENGDDSLQIPAGGSLELTYRVVVRTPIDAAVALANSVWIDWTSLDADSVYERTGDGCPNITPPDDYCFGPAAAEGTAEPMTPPDLAQGEHPGDRGGGRGLPLPDHGPGDALRVPDLRRPHPGRPDGFRRRPALPERHEDRGLRALDSRQYRHGDEPRDRGSRRRHRHPGRRADRHRDHGRAGGHGDERERSHVHQHGRVPLQPDRRRRRAASGRAIRGPRSR